MSVFQRLGNLILEDLGAILPGSGVPLNRETSLRLVLYAALLCFTMVLFFPDIFTPRRAPVLREMQPAPTVPRGESAPSGPQAPGQGGENESESPEVHNREQI